MVITSVECPWCGNVFARKYNRVVEVEIACKHCKKPIYVKTDSTGWVVVKKRAPDMANLLQVQEQPEKSSKNRTSVSIGAVHGIVSFGGDINITHIYNETVKSINEAKNINEEQKNEAKGILEYVRTYASPFLPVIAEAIKKALGL